MRRYLSVLSVICLLVIYGCSSEVKSEPIVYIDSIQLFENFEMKKEYDSILELNIKGDTRKLDSLSFLIEKTADAKLIENYTTEQLYLQQSLNKEFDNLSQKYTKMVAERLDLYVKDFAKELNLELIISSRDGSVIYVDEKRDLTDQLIEFVNKKYNQ